MAKLNQDKITITISEMVRNDEPTALILDAEVMEQLLAVIQELVGDKRMIEIEVDNI
jgi:ABC-type arginine transport system ATPase subunit